jgi:hypothetical protein
MPTPSAAAAERTSGALALSGDRVGSALPWSAKAFSVFSGIVLMTPGTTSRST